jgi:hypothetical protein
MIRCNLQIYTVGADDDGKAYWAPRPSSVAGDREVLRM